LSTTTITNLTRKLLWERSIVADLELSADKLAVLWHPEGRFQIGAQPPVTGRENIRQFFKGFFGMGLFSRLEHAMGAVWDLDDALIYTATAVFSQSNGGTLAIPYTNIVRYRDDLFADYRVFIDTKPLFG
jgi:hypothetical protein